MHNKMPVWFHVMFFLLLAAGLPAAVLAQANADRLATLSVDLWPDYDQPSMLVLLTGQLPPDATLPATITIPVPDGADINAVARIGETGGLFSDIEYSFENGRLTFTTPSPGFRVEYYTPYQVNGNTHSYRFEWTSDLAIDSLTTVVQQPLAATSITIEPAPTGSELRNDDLTYFTLPPRAVAPGETVTVELSYEVTSPLLSAAPATTPSPIEPAATSPATDSTLLWLLGLAAAALLVAGAFYLGRRGGAGPGRKPKPKPVRPESARPPAGPPATATARFCHQCGQQAEKGDVFCRKCGTKLKT